MYIVSVSKRNNIADSYVTVICIVEVLSLSVKLLRVISSTNKIFEYTYRLCMHKCQKCMSEVYGRNHTADKNIISRLDDCTVKYCCVSVAVNNVQYSVSI